MSNPDDNIGLRHMLDHAREAVKLIQGKSREDLDNNRVLQLAVVRLTEIIGEAAARVSGQCREGYTTIPWAQIIGTRNRLIHRYDLVDQDILWQTLNEDLPTLIVELEGIPFDAE